MTDCVFCNIINKTIESKVLAETEDVIVIPDIMPKAPVHLLVISKAHVASVNDLDEAHKGLIGEMILAAQRAARAAGVADSGYKLVWNVGKDGGQVIPHIHVHVLGGKPLEE